MSGRGGAYSDDVCFAAQTFGSEHWKSFATALCGKVVDVDALPIHIAQITQALEERKSRRLQRTWIEREETEPWDFLGLLRACRERPWQRTSTLPSSASRIERLGVRSSCAGHRAVQPPPVFRPPRALAMLSAFMARLPHHLQGDQVPRQAGHSPGHGCHGREPCELFRCRRRIAVRCCIRWRDAAIGEAADCSGISQACAHKVESRAHAPIRQPLAS